MIVVFVDPRHIPKKYMESDDLTKHLQCLEVKVTFLQYLYVLHIIVSAYNYFLYISVSSGVPCCSQQLQSWCVHCEFNVLFSLFFQWWGGGSRYTQSQSAPLWSNE